MRDDITPTQPCFVYTKVNMASRQRHSKVWLYFTRTDDHRATCSACKTSISSKGGNTNNMQKHLSTQHAITLQECLVFERYGVKITLMNLNQATAARLTLALHLLILKVNSNSLLRSEEQRVGE